MPNEECLNVLVAARDAGVAKVIYASSSSVYGDTPELPKREDMKPDPKSPYAVTKLTGEYYCRIFNEIYGLKTVALRYFNVYGPRQDPSSDYAAVIPKFVNRVMAGKPPIIYRGRGADPELHVCARCGAGECACDGDGCDWCV